MEKQQNAWSKLTEHARECVLEDKQELKRYQNEEGNVVLFFNCVHDVVGAAFPREYAACQRFDLAQKVHTEPIVYQYYYVDSERCSTFIGLPILSRCSCCRL